MLVTLRNNVLPVICGACSSTICASFVLPIGTSIPYLEMISITRKSRHDFA
jgi:hypothetical protein